MENIKKQVIEVLQDCNDPELPIDLWNLGLIYDLKIAEKEDKKFDVSIIMSLTTPGCSMGGFMMDEIKTKLKRVETINLVDIQLTFDPPWSPEMLTEVGKEKLGI